LAVVLDPTKRLLVTIPTSADTGFTYVAYDCAPGLISKVKIDPKGVFSHADVHRALGCVEQRACLEQIECGAKSCRIVPVAS
jgi:hypothetical protein